MKLTEKTELYAKGNRHFTGRYKNHSVDIRYIQYHPLIIENIIPFWCFYVENLKTNYVFSSIGNKLEFSTYQECVDAAIKYIDKSLKKKEI